MSIVGKSTKKTSSGLADCANLGKLFAPNDFCAGDGMENAEKRLIVIALRATKGTFFLDHVSLA
jgi:hypothetical protein